MMGTQLLRVQLCRPFYHIICTCRSLPLLSSASDSFWFWSPGLVWRLLNLPSQDKYSLRQATAGRTLYPRDCTVLNLGNFRIGFLFTGVHIFLYYRYIILFVFVIKKYSLYLSVQPVSTSILRLIAPLYLYFFLVFCIICWYALSRILLLSEEDITLIYTNWDGGNKILLAVYFLLLLLLLSNFSLLSFGWEIFTYLGM